ncbi:MAG: hypothetical protein GDA38_16435 [Hormoscilla sp. SP12CHS1]|nr:hypothetical protein [Hormoscilla sp. SP12CHS1]
MLEIIYLAGIARITGVCKLWLQNMLIRNMRISPAKVSGKQKGKLTIECDEMWSFVKSKDNKQWIRLALDTKTREIVGVYVGA